MASSTILRESDVLAIVGWSETELLRDTSLRKNRQGALKWQNNWCLATKLAVTLRPALISLANASRPPSDPRPQRRPDSSGAPTITHDGVTVAKEIELEDPYQNMGAQLLKAATKTNDIAGDGTTTATVLAQIIVTEGLKNVAPARTRCCSSAALKGRRCVGCQHSQPGHRHQHPRRDRRCGRYLGPGSRDRQPDRRCYGEGRQDGVITVESKTGLAFPRPSSSKGMQFDRGYISPISSPTPSAWKPSFEDPYILLTDKKISAAADIVPCLRS